MRKLLVLAVFGLVALGNSSEAATTFVVDDDGVQCPNRDYSMISAAVGAAMSGDTIQVCPGTYTENVVLNKSLTLLGAQAGVDARGRVSPAESVVMPFMTTTSTLTLQTGSLGSIIDGFTFLGGSFTGGSGHSGAIESTSGPIDNLQLLNNRIRGFTAGSGVFLNDKGINITVNQNEIDGMMKIGNADLFHLDQDNFDGFWFTNNRVVNGITGTGFFVDGTRNVDHGTAGSRIPLFSGNFINNNQTGVNLGRLAWGDGPITGNIFSNNLFDGLQGGPKNSTISQNTFDSNGRNGLALTSFGNTTDPARGAQNNTITQNCFTGNGFLQVGAGIFFSATQFPGTISTNVANQNNISGNAMGARYPLPGTETIDATSNWWGAADGPGLPDGSGSGDGVDGHGKINFTPFLTSQAGGTPCTLTPGKATGGGKIESSDDSLSLDTVLELATLLINSSSSPTSVGSQATFGFTVTCCAAKGNLEYNDHNADVRIKATSIDTFMISSPSTACPGNPTGMHAQFKGMAQQSDTTGSVMFTVDVDDCGEPGSSTAGGVDMFSIKTDAGYSASGPLIGGNIQIKPVP